MRRGACAARRRGAARHRVKDSQWISTEPSSRVGPKSLPRPVEQAVSREADAVGRRDPAPDRRCGGRAPDPPPLGAGAGRRGRRPRRPRCRRGAGGSREGADRGPPVRGGGGRAAAAGPGRAGRCGPAVPLRPRGDRGGAAAGRFGGCARIASGRGDRRLSHNAGQSPEADPRAARACPGVLPQGRGQARQAAFRAGAGRQPAVGRRAQRQPVPRRDPGAQALEPARRGRCGAGQQYRRRLGRADHLYRRQRPTPPLPPRPGGADLVGDRHLGLGRRRIPVPAGRPLSPARRGRHHAARIQEVRIRPDVAGGTSRAALAGRQVHRGEPAGVRAP